ncbi:hypothetical protein DRQ17_01420 [bacterium]|nr:MAG: hypothetical protein DRQ17_01420 [bacterium]RKZ20344.1 MAG: hypothetical protein DRQ23_09235 [bacterium]
MRIVIANPGAGKRVVAHGDIKRIFGNDVKFYISRYPGHSTVLARQAIKEGAKEIIAMGGDGTFNEVLNGFFENDRLINPEASLGLFLSGSSGDTMKTIKMPERIDVIRTEFVDFEGRRSVRYCINMINIGLGGLVARTAYKLPRELGGYLRFMFSTFIAFPLFHGAGVELFIDGEFKGSYLILDLAIANGRYTGGGMFMSPYSKENDGVLDVVVIEKLSLFKFIQNIPRLYQGTHLKRPEVHVFKGRRVTVKGKTTFEMDGETPGRLPLIATVVPGAIRVFPVFYA